MSSGFTYWFPCDNAIRESRFSGFTWSGTHRGSFLEIPATGKRINGKGVVIDRLLRGKMADSRFLIDNLIKLPRLDALPAHRRPVDLDSILRADAPDLRTINL